MSEKSAAGRLRDKLDLEAEKSGYHLNPDRVFTLGLAEGLLMNEERYGYWACPCRLASGVKDEDLDIICPCDYRDPDLTDFGTCYCGLYVSEEVRDGKRKLEHIPDRRPASDKDSGVASQRAQSSLRPVSSGSLEYPVWRCKVCGYLCARDSPPEVCPICGAKKERFQRFL